MSIEELSPVTERALARFRFYEELNDFLPWERRKRDFHYRCARAATIKNAIEALGVPHTEVELILVNGESVDFGYLVRDGDRISVYPKFEALDIRELLRVRDEPLRDIPVVDRRQQFVGFVGERAPLRAHQSGLLTFSVNEENMMLKLMLILSSSLMLASTECCR